MEKEDTSSEVAETRLAFLEMLYSVSWFLLDICWLFKLDPATYLFSSMAVIGNLCAYNYQERKAVPLLVAGAESSWLLMNVFWIRQDLAGPEWCLIMAKTFIALGLLQLAAALLLSSSKEKVLELLTRPFRRLKASFLDK